MADSLKAHGVKFTLWVLCLTEECKRILDAIGSPDIKGYSLNTLEKVRPELQNAKRNRSISEYYFTLSPFWPNFLLATHSEIRSITYLDADLEFLSSPQCLFNEVGDSSIGIIEHRFHPNFDISRHSGRFNVGWVYFRRDRVSFRCLAKWQAQCLDWCKDHPENGKFADQKYLDSWPDDYKNTHIFSHAGANLAPWNLNTHKIGRRGELLLSDDRPIVFYHFHMIKAFDANHLSTSLEIYRVPIEVRKQIIDWLYVPHILRLLEKERKLSELGFEIKLFRTSRDYSKIDLHHRSDKSLNKRIEEGELINLNVLQSRLDISL
jgi:hypothetical protein